MSKRNRDRRRTVREGGEGGRLVGEGFRLRGRAAVAHVVSGGVTVAFDDAVMILRPEGSGAYTTVLLRTWFDLARFVLLLTVDVGSGGNGYLTVGEVPWDQDGQAIGQGMTEEHKAYYQRAMVRIAEITREQG